MLPNGKINLAKIDQLAFVISSLVSKGKEIVLVSSGAMGFGLNVLNMEKRPVEMAAAAGCFKRRPSSYDEPLLADFFPIIG